MPPNPCLRRQWINITYSFILPDFLGFFPVLLQFYHFQVQKPHCIQSMSSAVIFPILLYFSGLLCLMGFAFIPSVLHNSRYGQWVSFSETLTLRSHSFVVITISNPTTAYSFFPYIYHFGLIYISFCLSFQSVPCISSAAYRVALCLYSME